MVKGNAMEGKSRCSNDIIILANLYRKGTNLLRNSYRRHYAMYMKFFLYKDCIRCSFCMSQRAEINLKRLPFQKAKTI